MTYKKSFCEFPRSIRKPTVPDCITVFIRTLISRLSQPETAPGRKRVATPSGGNDEIRGETITGRIVKSI